MPSVVYEYDDRHGDDDGVTCEAHRIGYLTECEKSHKR